MCHLLGHAADLPHAIHPMAFPGKYLSNRSVGDALEGQAQYFPTPLPRAPPDQIQDFHESFSCRKTNSVCLVPAKNWSVPPRLRPEYS